MRTIATRRAPDDGVRMVAASSSSSCLSPSSCRRSARAAFALVVSPVLLAACGSAPSFGVRAETPPQPTLEEGVARTEETFSGAKGVTLFARGYRPAKEAEVRGVVVFMNGLKDHGDHYAALSQHLVHHGYAAYAFDLRGEGRSSGARVEVDKFDDYVDDLATYVERVRAKEPGKPIFVYGHSLGGAIVALYGVERHPDVAGLIVSGPGLALDGPPVQIAAVRLLDVVAPGAPVLDLPNAKFSRDPAIVADMDHDPLIHQSNPSAHLAAEALDASRRVWARPEALTVPLLAMHGAADQITAPIASRDLVARAGSTDKTLRVYRDFSHDLVHEPGHERVYSDITSWLDAHTGGPPMPGDADSRTLAGAPLGGDHGGAGTSVQLDARGERIGSVGGNDARLAATGGLRLRQAIGRIGWFGGLDLRAGAEKGFRWEADAHPLGVGARFGALQLGLTAGLGGRGINGFTVLRSPIELTFEAPLGPLRLLSRGSLARRWNYRGDGERTGSVLGIAEEANVFVGFRIGRDRRYWQDVHAGSGPFLGVTYNRRGQFDIWGLALGIDLWGAR
jgi:acylglycerol lipase